MKWLVPHPSMIGFEEHFGDLAGQKTDYRLALPDDRSIHVREYDHYYLIHWDSKDPKIDPIGHLIEDAPHWLAVLGLTILGILGGVCWWRHSIEEKDKEEI